MQQYLHKDMAEPEQQVFASDPTAAFDDYLTESLRVAEGRKIVFLLDEFERLEEQIKGGKLHEDILHYLRYLMQHRQGLNFLLVGAPRIRYMTEGYWGIFFNIALRHHLSRLKPQEAVDLITEPVKDYLEYDALALERMQNLTGNQPYLIHVLCEQLIIHCNRQKKSYVTITDVNTALEAVLDEQESSIRWVWDQSTSAQKLILSILAQEKGGDGTALPLNDIRAEYRAVGVPFNEQAVREDLQRLVEEDIVEERAHGNQFRIPVGLTKEWLRKHKPPRRVAREEHLNDHL